MVNILFSNIIYTEGVDDKAEGDGTCVVLP